MKTYIATAIEYSIDDVHYEVKAFKNVETARAWADKEITSQAEEYPNGKLTKHPDCYYLSCGLLSFMIEINEVEICDD